MIQNLDKKKCACEPLEKAVEPIFDGRTVKGGLIRLNKGEKFTIREFAPQGVFGYTELSAKGLKCFTEESTFTEAIYAPFLLKPRYRQKTFVATADDCREEMKQAELIADVPSTDVFQTWQLVVWPTRKPEPKGQVIMLDEWDKIEGLRFSAKHEFTVQVSEQATATGYIWEAPTQKFKCVELKDPNLGKFVTGYQQWHFMSLD